jgi:hypothetical protein
MIGERYYCLANDLTRFMSFSRHKQDIALFQGGDGGIYGFRAAANLNRTGRRA